MVTISSAELQKNFGRYKEAAQREPIRVTSHGRESLVVLSAEEYRRLAALDTRCAYHPADLPPELREALEKDPSPSSEAAIDRVFGCLARAGEAPVSVEAMDAAVLTMAAGGGEEADEEPAEER